MKLRKIVATLTALCLTAMAAPAGADFSDVNQNDWFYESVTAMAQEGRVNGYPDGTFRPGAKITGAELVAVAARMRGLEPASPQNSHWAGGLMEAALKAGWYDWDELPPTAQNYDLPIARQLAVKIVMKAFAPEARGDYSTESAKIADFPLLDGRYYEPVLAAYASGIVTGDGNGRFNPRSGLTRAEACALLTRAAGLGGESAVPSPTTPAEEPVPISGGVSENGRLQVVGTRLCNRRGEPVVLRGMSSHGLQWYPQFLTDGVISSVAERGANLIRLAMYTAEGGYLSDGSLKNTLYAAADRVTAHDMYVIIDWHILSDGDPMSHLSEAKAFFAEAAEKYRGNPAVIYEICNEPNGGVTWSGSVKPYAEEVISVIRAIDPEAVILVGSPTWSQDLHEAAKDPLSGDNIMYTCHFYAGTHGQWLRDRIDAAIAAGLPVFVSEWGVSAADGGGGVFAAETREWLDFMAERGLSWANWSLCDKNESSAALKPGCDPSDGISDGELSESGRIVFDAFAG